MTLPRSRYFRYTILAVILGLVVYLALGYGKLGFEAYCPFGGAESLWGLFTAGEFSCTLGPLNLSIMLTLLLLAVIAKKSFCGWACPIGFLGELAGRLSGKLWKNRPHLSESTNGILKLLRYLVLVVALYFTFRTGELVLRGYDPFFLIFSDFGHGSAGIISVIALAIIVIGAFVVPMLFCRYLCPMGAVFDPFSRLGLIKIVRNESKCTSCGICSEACMYDIPVERLKTVRHRDCTNCLECVDACPESDTLQVKAGL